MITYLQSTAAEFKPGTDTDILITGGIYWSVVECGVGLISCCLPTVYGVFRTKALMSTFHSTKLTSLKSNPSEMRGSYSGNSMPRGTKGGMDRHWNDSQESDVELAGRLPGQTQNLTRAEGPRDVESWGTGPRDQILITKTFGAEKQTSIGEMA